MGFYDRRIRALLLPRVPVRSRGERVNSYTIEATGLDGWMAYRYQYKTGASDYFGYAETKEEALEIIKRAGVVA